MRQLDLFRSFHLMKSLNPIHLDSALKKYAAMAQLKTCATMAQPEMSTTIEPCHTCKAFLREKTHQPCEIGVGGPRAPAHWLSLASRIDGIALWVFYKLGYNIYWSLFYNTDCLN